jgi:hypothetical protein
MDPVESGFAGHRIAVAGATLAVRAALAEMQLLRRERDERRDRSPH